MSSTPIVTRRGLRFIPVPTRRPCARRRISTGWISGQPDKSLTPTKSRHAGHNTTHHITPLWPLTGFGGVLLALALLSRLLPQNIGRVAMGAGFALGLHAVIVLTSLYPSYDGQALANRLAQLAPNGLAVSNVEYHAEVNFLGRLTNPVALTPDLDSLRLWALAHPQGTVFGRINENPLTAAPQEVFHFMGQDWGLWPAAAISRE